VLATSRVAQELGDPRVGLFAAELEESRDDRRRVGAELLVGDEKPLQVVVRQVLEQHLVVDEPPRHERRRRAVLEVACGQRAAVPLEPWLRLDSVAEALQRAVELAQPAVREQPQDRRDLRAGMTDRHDVPGTRERTCNEPHLEVQA